MSLVGVVPARGGSKRIPRKNLALCAGKPLLEWTAEAALGSRSLDRCLLSTDDPEIAETGRSMGLEVPFLRPANLACDETPILPVLHHLVEWLSESSPLEAVVLLQPSSPLRTARHVDEAVNLFRSRTAASVVSVMPVPHQCNPLKVMKEEGEAGLSAYLPSAYVPGRPSDLPRVFARNGPAIVVSRPNVILAGTLYGRPNLPYVMAPHESVDIDEPFDLVLADFLLRQSAEPNRETMP